MMTNVLLERDSLAVRDGRLSFKVRLPWYRSLPLSVIVIDEVKVDGRTIDATDLSFELNGTQHPVSDLADLTSSYWYVRDSMTILVNSAQEASEHEIDITLSFFPPYIADFRRKTRGTALMKAA
ncbi:hypothetical protein H4S14_003198 [Agrobacterium vitis]|nr:hypothetical protein [Agrobacterium vitis]MBE1439433.1 hypothetical protein [Agrobacterium vitis]